MLLISFIANPCPSPPTWNTFLPIARNRSSLAAKVSARSSTITAPTGRTGVQKTFYIPHQAAARNWGDYLTGHYKALVRVRRAASGPCRIGPGRRCGELRGGRHDDLDGRLARVGCGSPGILERL